MAENEYTILDSWPNIENDLKKFLEDPYKWVADEFERALQAQPRPDRKKLQNLLDILKMLNDIPTTPD